jgi:hypothetical protein
VNSRRCRSSRQRRRGGNTRSWTPRDTPRRTTGGKIPPHGSEPSSLQRSWQEKPHRGWSKLPQVEITDSPAMVAPQLGSSFRKFFFRFRSSRTDDVSHISISNHSTAFLAFCGPIQFLFHVKPYNGRKEGDATEVASPGGQVVTDRVCGTFAIALDFAPLKFQSNQVFPPTRAEWSTQPMRPVLERWSCRSSALVIYIQRSTTSMCP